MDSLSLRDNPIGDHVLSEVVQRFPNLWYLDLAGTNVSDHGMRTLQNLGNLYTVNLERTYVTGLGVLKLYGRHRHEVIIEEEKITSTLREEILTMSPTGHNRLYHRSPPPKLLPEDEFYPPLVW